MADAGLVARSPIAAAAPVLVERGWEICGRRSSALLRIVDCAPLAKVLVKAHPAGGAGAVAAALGVSTGRAVRDGKGMLVVGSGPGEWLLLGAPGAAGEIADRAGRFDAGSAGQVLSVFDHTHGRALVRISGDAAHALLAKVCAIDLRDDVTPDGRAFRTSVANVVTDVIRDDAFSRQRSYLLHCERSFGQYLFDALVDAGEEFGIDVDGFRFPGI